jgi:hypothetical protein
MPPKRSNEKDGKGKESELPSGEWTYSKCFNNDLLRYVSKGLLQEKNLANWRPSFRQTLPMENVDQIVSFYHFSERDLALPTCFFFRGLLYFYGLELHHLNPNSICHIAIFIHFCEAFLEIEPHWDLFRYLFRVMPQPTSKNPSIRSKPVSLSLILTFMSYNSQHLLSTNHKCTHSFYNYCSEEKVDMKSVEDGAEF